MYRIKFSYPNLPPGEKFIIDGLGELENGKTYTVNEELHAQFRAAHATVKSGPYDERGHRKNELIPGRPMDEYFKDVEGVTVTHATVTTGGDKQ